MYFFKWKTITYWSVIEEMFMSILFAFSFFLLDHRQRKNKDFGSRNLWTDANIPRSPQANSTQTVVTWRQQLEYSLMLILFRVFRLILSRLANSLPATYRAVDVLKQLCCAHYFSTTGSPGAPLTPICLQWRLRPPSQEAATPLLRQEVFLWTQVTCQKCFHLRDPVRCVCMVWKEAGTGLVKKHRSLYVKLLDHSGPSGRWMIKCQADSAAWQESSLIHEELSSAAKRTPSPATDGLAPTEPWSQHQLFL